MIKEPRVKDKPELIDGEPTRKPSNLDLIFNGWAETSSSVSNPKVGATY